MKNINISINLFDYDYDNIYRQYTTTYLYIATTSTDESGNQTVMSDEERDDILKYNIGPDQMDDLDNIKAFLEVNEFKPLDIRVKDEKEE